MTRQWGIILSALVWWTSAEAHETQIVQCDRNLKVEHVTKLGELLNENGTVSEFYDRNDDGRLDIEAVSHRGTADDDDRDTRIAHNRHPFFYIVDLDFDGTPDAAYVDIGGHGRCEDIRFYKDLRAPRPENYDNQEHGHAEWSAGDSVDTSG
jgi:hypothetical protein